MKLSKKLIKSYLPNDVFTDGSRLNGILLNKNSYDLYCIIRGIEYDLRTAFDSEVVKTLRKHFDVEYKEHFWAHYYKYTIKLKISAS